jgi:Ser/Thr protein kinase RdoA (MazF antagonist)
VEANLLPVTYSILAADALLVEVAHAYPIAAPVSCQLLRRGSNDTYVLTTREDRDYLVRVYRARGRTPSEIAYELELLAHLAAKGVPVSVPIADKDGALSRPLAAPEGTRQLVLLTYARGTPLAWDKEEHSYLAGAIAARIHSASDDFVSPHARFCWDLGHLIDVPLAAIRPFLEHRPEDWSYLEGLVARLRVQITAAAESGLDWGLCHGELNGGDIYLTENQTVSVIDFARCSPGWRAYDLAGIQWAALGQVTNAIWHAFLKGYTERRRLAAVDLAAVPLFHAICHLLSLGILAENAAEWGSLLMGNRLLDQELTFFRKWESEHF